MENTEVKTIFEWMADYTGERTVTNNVNMGSLGFDSHKGVPIQVISDFIERMKSMGCEKIEAWEVVDSENEMYITNLYATRMVIRSKTQQEYNMEYQLYKMNMSCKNYAEKKKEEKEYDEYLRLESQV